LKRLSLAVAPAQAGERLDRFIAAAGGISRGLARRTLDAGGVFLDGKRCKTASRGLWPGQQVVVNLEESGHAIEPVAPLDSSRLLFCDADIAVVDKPAGVPAQPTLTSDQGTLPDLVGALLGAPVTLVHRLDRETSGVTIFARTKAAAAALAEAFRVGTPEKTYLALTVRAPEPADGRIDAPLGPDPVRQGRRTVIASGDPAATRYRTVEVGSSGAALVEAKPETGRTHQIRAHLTHLGAPLLGDPRYGGPRQVGALGIPRVMLHARRLEIDHPVSGVRLTFEAPVPEDFAGIQQALVSPAVAS
jgi:23S rRNA pseudouridine1911/1915/1917 synthase